MNLDGHILVLLSTAAQVQQIAPLREAESTFLHDRSVPYCASCTCYLALQGL